MPGVFPTDREPTALDAGQTAAVGGLVVVGQQFLVGQCRGFFRAACYRRGPASGGGLASLFWQRGTSGLLATSVLNCVIRHGGRQCEGHTHSST